MRSYDDLFIRDALDDTGAMPSAAASASMSPDIICWGTEVIPDPERYLVENYDTTWYKNVVHGQTNYIYCRVTNLAPGAETGSLYLYVAPGGIMADIGVWRQNMLTTGIPDQDFLQLDARRSGDVVVGDSAFQWSPPAPGHYCFVAQIVTPDHPNPLPEAFNSSEEYVLWVLDNPAVSWRNVTVVDGTTPPEFQQAYTFSNLDDFERECLIKMTAEGLPRDSMLSMVCPARGPEPPIDTSQQTGRADYWTLSVSSFLPANFSGLLTATVTLPPGFVWGGDMKVRVEFFNLIKSEDSDYLKSFGLPIADIDPDHARAGFAIRLASYTILARTEETLPS
jgi:hypothetical protein